MQTKQKHREGGFTLVELITSIGVSSIVLMVIASLMGITQRRWTDGKEQKDMTGEMSLAVEKIVRDVDTQHIDSISVSSLGDTLFIGAGIKYYKDSADSNLVFDGPGTIGFNFLEGKTTTFIAQKPFIDASGDTLTKAVGVVIATNSGNLADSTNLVIVPRAK
jgi:type II secretory pathway pseudopilin PulG